MRNIVLWMYILCKPQHGVLILKTFVILNKAIEIPLITFKILKSPKIFQQG